MVNISVISINGNIMQIANPQPASTQNVNQTATTVAQGVPQNQQQNIVMVCLYKPFHIISI